MKVIDARINGPHLDLLIELGPDYIVAARTALNNLELSMSYARPVEGRIELRIFQIETMPDDWRERIKRAALPAPRKGLPKP